MTMTVLVLTGSLRSASITTQIAAIALEHPPAGVSTTAAERLDGLPFYNQDLDTSEPSAAVARLRAQVTAADAVLFVTPENNGSVSAVLKNAIDWLSRPRDNAALRDKPAALLVAGWSLTSVEIHLEQILHVAGARVIPSNDRRLSLKTFRGNHPADAPHVRRAITHALSALSDSVAQPEHTNADPAA